MKTSFLKRLLGLSLAVTMFVTATTSDGFLALAANVSQEEGTIEEPLEETLPEVESVQENLVGAAAAPVLLVNGVQNSLTVSFGEPVVPVVQNGIGLEGGTPVVSWGVDDGSHLPSVDPEQVWVDWTNSSKPTEPGSYLVSFEAMDSDNENYYTNIESPFLLTITKATLKTPVITSFANGTASWEAVTHTTSIQNVAIEGDVSYTVTLFKNGQQVNQFNTQETSYDFTSAIDENDYGTYTFSVKASATSSRYEDSAIASNSPSFVPKDKHAPTISSYTFEGGNLKASVSDSDTGLAAYAFSVKSSKDDLEAADWTAKTGKDVNLSYAPTTSGVYYLYAKDADGNIAVSSSSISIAVITYHNYYENNVKTVDKKVAVTVPCNTLASQTYKGHTFLGWYKTYSEGVFQDPVTSITAVEDVTLYGKWESKSITVSSITVDSDHAAVLTDDGYTYDSSKAKLSVSVSGADELDYDVKWYKVVNGGDDIEITGEGKVSYDAENHKSTLKVSGVAESGKYYATVAFDRGQEEQPIKSEEVSVKINPVELTLTTTAPVGTFHYLDDAPNIFSYSIDESDLVAGEELDDIGLVEGTLGTDYEKGDDAGTYKMTASGFKADNYKFKYVETTYVVLSKAVSNALPNGVSISIPEGSYVFTPGGVEPEVTVLDDALVGENKTVADTEYEVSYANNAVAGTATITVTFKNNYSGTMTRTFTVLKANFTPSIVFDSEIEIDGVNVKGWKYDGKDHMSGLNPIRIDTNTSGGAVTYKYFVNDEWVTSAPKNAGTYKVKASIAATSQYEAVETAEVDYVITKRNITITSGNVSEVFDGNAHINDNYEITGDGFVTGEGLKSCTVTGTITDVGTAANTFTYILNSATDAVNYNIEKVEGTLEITPQELTYPSTIKWDRETAGLGSWVAVVKPGLTTKYILQLYRKDTEDSTPEKVGDEIEEASFSHNFLAQMKIDAAANGIPKGGYLFSVKTVPASGAKMDNYKTSDFSPISSFNDNGANYYATKISVQIKDGDAGEGVESVTINDKASDIVFQGESATLKMTEVHGYSSGWDGSWGFGGTYNGVSLERTYFSNTSVMVDFNTKPSQNIVVLAGATDDMPHLDSFEGQNTSGNESVKLTFSAHDARAMSKWMITKTATRPSANDSGWMDPGTVAGEYAVTISNTGTVEGKNYRSQMDGTIYVKEAGSYYIWVKDTANHVDAITEIDDSDPENIKHPFKAVVVNEITLDKGDDNAVVNGLPEKLYKVKGTTITLPTIAGKLSLDGYEFKNWHGTSGLYADGSDYSANKNETLKAEWTNEYFTYKVNYYYMTIDGENNGVYPETPSESAEFSGTYKQQILYTNTNIQKYTSKYTIDLSNENNKSIDSLTSNTQEINIYYTLKQFKITFEYTDLEGVKKTKKTDTYYCGQAVTSEATKPSEAGYTFIGWLYGESGSKPEVMPANDITARGYFEADNTSYMVAYYLESLENPGQYELSEVQEKFTIATNVEGEYEKVTHGKTIAENKIILDDEAGFTKSQTKTTRGSVGGADPSAISSIGYKVSALEGEKLYVNVYYTRNSYSLTLNVYMDGRGGDPIYSKSWPSIKYQQSLTTDYANYDKANWLNNQTQEVKNTHELVDTPDWSTGGAPSTMPDGDVVVSRDYVATDQVQYYVNVYYQKAPGSAEYTKETQAFYANEGATITIGEDSSNTISINLLKSIYGNIASFEYEPSHEGTVASGTAIKGTDINDSLVLSCYFKRPTEYARVYYYYFDGSEQKQIGYVVKAGDFNALYHINPNLLLNGTGTPTADVINADGTTNGNYVSSNVYINSETGKFTTIDGDNPVRAEEYAFSGDTIDVRWHTQYKNPANFGASSWTYTTYNASGTAVSKGEYSLFGDSTETATTAASNYPFNRSHVYYIKAGYGTAAHRYIQLEYNTKNLARFKTDVSAPYYTGSDQQPLTVKINGEDYKVRVANECDFYKDSAYDSEAKTWVKAGDLKEGISPITVTGLGTSITSRISATAYYTTTDFDANNDGEGDGDKVLYLLDNQNTIITGHEYSLDFYSGLKNAKVGDEAIFGNATKALEVYKAKEAQLAQENQTHDGSASAAVLYGSFNTHSWSYINGNPTIYLYYEYTTPYTLTYILDGQTRSQQFYSGTEITKAKIDAKTTEFAQRDGYEIVWYSKNQFTDANKLTVPFNMTGNKNIYGRYEKKVFDGHQYIYYETPKTFTVGGEQKNYLTVADITTLSESDSKFTSSVVDTSEVSVVHEYIDYATQTNGVSSYTSTTTEYYYDGELILIDKAVPQLAFTNNVLDYNADAYKKYGFKFDNTNTDNSTNKYCDTQAVDLKAYYKRLLFDVTWDFNDDNATDEETTRHGYNAIIERTDPTRAGYNFSGWTFYKANGVDESGKTIWQKIENFNGKMPEENLRAKANWTPTSFNYPIMHYMQKLDNTYDTKVVEAIVETTPSQNVSKVKVSEEDTAYNGTFGVYTYGSDKIVALTRGTAVLYYYGTIDEGLLSDTFNTSNDNLIAIQTQTSDMVSESSYDCNRYNVLNDFADLNIYSYGFTMYRLADDIKKLEVKSGVAEQFTADTRMDLAYYYTRSASRVFTTTARVSDDLDGTKGLATGLTVSGAGNWTYGSYVTFKATVAEGYSFVAWYDKDDFEANGESATKLSTDTSYSVYARKNMNVVALSKPAAVALPTVTLENLKTYKYGYKDEVDNVITAQVDMSALPGTYYVAGYKWYKGTGDDKVLISGETAQTCHIEAGLGVGSHDYTCEVIVGRKDNGRTNKATATTGESPVVVTNGDMRVSATNYTGIYDGENHSISLSITGPSNKTVYYAVDTPLDSTNYLTEGSTTNPGLKNVKWDEENNKASTYTVYYYVVDSSSPKSYADCSGSATVEIEPRNVTIKTTKEIFSKTYDGTTAISGENKAKFQAQTNGLPAFYKIENLADSDKNAELTLDCDAQFNDAHVDKANTVTITNFKSIRFKNGTDDHNYKITNSAALTFSAYITARELDISWQNGEADTGTTFTYEYDGKEHKPYAVVTSGIISSDDGKVSVYVAGAQKAAGTYSAKAVAKLTADSASRSSDYSFSSEKESQTYKVLKRNITVTPKDDTVTYDGQNHGLSTFEYTNFDPATLDMSIICKANDTYKTAGTHSIKTSTVKITDEDRVDVTENFTITMGTGTLVINKKSLTVSGITSIDKTYNGDATALLDKTNIVLSGIVGSDDVSVNKDKITGVYSGADAKNAGSNKTIDLSYGSDILTGTAKGNYEFDDENSQKTVTGNIKKKDVTVSIITSEIQAVDYTYGDALPFTDLNPTTCSFVSYAGFIDGESKINTDITGSLSFTGYNRYGAVSASQGTDSADKTISVDVSSLSSPNYNFVAGNTGKLTVKKKTVSIVKDSDTAVTKEYDATTTASVAASRLSIEGLVNSDAVTIASNYVAQYNSAAVALANKVTVSGLKIEGAKAGNYKLSNTTVEFDGNITKAPLSVTAKNKSITYGDAKPSSNADYTIEYSGWKGQDKLSDLSGSLVITTNYDPATPANRVVGDYNIVPSGLTSNNYEISFNNGKLSVGKKKITIQATDKPFNYSKFADSDIAFTGTATGWVEAYSSDEASIVSGVGAEAAAASTYECSVVTTSLKGDYDITVKQSVIDGLNANASYNANYLYQAAKGKASVISGDITIETDAITISDKVYDGTTGVAKSQISIDLNKVSGLSDADKAYIQTNLADDCYGFDITAVYNNKNVGTGKAISFTEVKFGNWLDQRYNNVVCNATATSGITKANLTIKANNCNVNYGSTLKTYTDADLTFTGFVNSETKDVLGGSFTYTTNYSGTSVFTEAGATGITVSPSGYTSDNYSITYQDGDVTVKKVNLSKPENIAFDTTNIGTLNWDNVSGIGDVSVDHYEIDIYKDGGASPETTVSTTDGTTNSKDLSSTIRGLGKGIYTVKVRAIASTTNNVGNVNVGDSAASGEASIVATLVTPSFKSDAVTTLAGASLSINNSASRVMLAGETATVLVNIIQTNGAGQRAWTGYVVGDDSFTSMGKLTISGAQDTTTDGKYTGTVTLAADVTATEINPVVAITARPATVTETHTMTNDKVSFNYQACPRDEVTVGVAASDNITTSDYDYEYTWSVKTARNAQVTTPSPALIPSSTNIQAIPEGYLVGSYYLYCVVKATRKDNGQSITTSGAVTKSKAIIVSRANITGNVPVLSNWEFGSARNTPAMTQNHPEPSDPNYKLTFEYATSASAPESEWTETIPKNAGTYYVRGIFAETANYDKYVSAPTEFKITKATLGTPTNLKNSAIPGEAPYGRLNWEAVDVVKENAGAVGDSDSTIPVTYEVKLYRKANATATPQQISIGTNTTSNTYLDVNNYIRQTGIYYFTVQAKSGNTNNCLDGGIATETSVLKIGSEFQSSAKNPSTGANVYTKVYDGHYEGTYDGTQTKGITIYCEDPSPENTYKWYKDGVDLNYNGTYMLIANVSDSGKYTCEVTSYGNVIFVMSQTVTISKKTLKITSTSDEKVYDGSALTNNNYTIADDYGLAETDKVSSIDITGSQTAKGSSANTISNAVITSKLTGVGNTTANYNITYVTGSLKVTEKAISDSTVEIADIPDQTYTGVAIRPTIVVTDSESGKTLVENTDYTYTCTSNIYVGTATITVTGKGNYKGTTTKTFVIVKRKVKFKSSNIGGVYKATPYTLSDATAANKKAAISLVDESGYYSTLGSGDAVNNVTFTGTKTDVGNYTGANTFESVLIYKGSTNVTPQYDIEYEYGDIVITKATDTVTVKANLSKGYDGTAVTITDDQTDVERKGTGAVTFKYYDKDKVELAQAPKDVGNYFVKAFVAESANYNAAESAYKSFAISKGNQTITASDVEVTYDGQTHYFSGAATSGDGAITYSGDGKTAANESGYTVTITAAATDNYNKATLTKKLIIKKRPVTIALDPASKAYDGTALTSSAFSVTAGTLAGGQVAAVTVPTTCTITNVGTKVNTINNVKIVDASNTDVTTNYNITKTASTLEVTKANPSLTVVANFGPSKPYSTTATTINDFTITYSGAASGVTGGGSRSYTFYEVNGGVETEITSPNAPKEVGNYRLKVSYSEGSNFNAVGPIACDFSIVPINSAIPVTANGYSAFYDALNHKGGVVTSDTAATVYFGTVALDSTNYNTDGSTTNPEYSTIGVHKVYYYVTSPHYANPASGSFDVEIKAHTYDVTYHGNLSGVSVTGVPATQTKVELTTLTLSTDEPTATGYEFQGWATTARGDKVYDPGDEYATNAALDLYAVWKEKIEGTVTFDYNYIDTIDGLPAVTAYEISTVKAILYKVINGNKTKIDEKTVTIASRDGANKSLNNPFSFTSQSVNENGKACTYEVEIEEVEGQVLDNFGTTVDGNRNYTLKYSPHDFNLNIEISLDDTGLTTETIPSSIDVTVLAKNSVNGSWATIDQYRTTKVTCTYNAASKKYTNATTYPVWKVNDNTGKTYYYAFKISSVTVGGVEKTSFGGDYTTSVYTDDSSITPVHFVPNDATLPAGDGTVEGGNGNNGVMTGNICLKKYKIAFDANGGDESSIPTTITKLKGYNITIPSELPSRNGKTDAFKEWNTSKRGNGTAYQPGDIFTEDEDTTLYAMWKGGASIVLPTKPESSDPTTPSGSDSSSSQTPSGDMPSESKVVNPSQVDGGEANADGTDESGKGQKIELINSKGETGESIITGGIVKSNEELKEYLNKEELSKVNAGEDLTVRLEITEKVENKEKEKKQAVKEALKDNEKIEDVFDINMYVQVGSDSERKLAPSDKQENITLLLPEKILKKIKKGATITLVRVYTDESGKLVTEVVDSVINDNSLVFVGDTKSTYALISGEKVPLFAVSTEFSLFNLIALILTLLFAILATIKKRKKYGADIAMGIISLIAYILSFSYGKMVIFNKYSVIFAVVLVAIIIVFAVGKPDEEKETSQE